jgi:hypothetical protein
MESMELNQLQLQFMFNVIAITATASLALTCILLKRDMNKLVSQLDLRRIQNRHRPGVSTTVAPDALAIMQQDIRQYVARRVQSWNAGPRTR